MALQTKPDDSIDFSFQSKFWLLINFYFIINERIFVIKSGLYASHLKQKAQLGDFFHLLCSCVFSSEIVQ